MFGELALVDPGVRETCLGSLLTKQKGEFPALFPEVASSDGAVLSGGSGIGECSWDGKPQPEMPLSAACAVAAAQCVSVSERFHSGRKDV